MTPDVGLAFVSLIFLVVFVALPVVAEPFYEFYISIGREVSTVLLLSVLAGAYYNGYMYTTLANGLFVVYVLYQMWTVYPRSDRRRLRQEIIKDQARFDPATSIDLQFANGTAVHDRPKMARKDTPTKPLLIFPPSKEVQAQMNG
jgi:hypothetical protein